MDSERMTETFERALAFTLRFEGGYVNDPDDRGGETNMGITQSTYDQWNIYQDKLLRSVKDITKKEVEMIYKTRYWSAGRCNHIASIDPNLAVVHFDSCVNHGTGQAAKFLQRAIGVKADGVIGKVTMSRLERTHSDVVKNYIEQRKAFFRYITMKRAANQKFINGWLRRADELLKYVQPESNLCSDLQTLMNKHGFDCGKVDNVAGQRTESAALVMMQSLFGKNYREVS